jgi:uncharacterized spore protein YtfJ
MDVHQLLSKVTDALTVARVFGEPIAHGDILVVPVARIRGGAGGGSGPGLRRHRYWDAESPESVWAMTPVKGLVCLTSPAGQGR